MVPITYLVGDATSPVANGSIIAHCCNDIGGWGKGFVLSISKKWPEPEEHYRSWFDRDAPKLGDVQFVTVNKSTVVANMIGQHGCGWYNGIPPIRYDALAKCLEKVAELAAKKKLSVHMPRIGCGLAGGTWNKVEAIILDKLSNLDISVYVYDLR